MEGKAALFKRFANIDAWPICLASQDTDEIVKAVACLASWITGQILNVCGGLTVHDGDNYEGLSRMVFGDDAIEETKTW